MEGFEFLCPSESVREGEFGEHSVASSDHIMDMVVTRHQGRVRAWLNVCPHQGRPLNFAPNRFLSDDQGRLVCAAHGAIFEPDSGRCVGGPCQGSGLKSIELVESGSKILFKAQS